MTIITNSVAKLQPSNKNLLKQKIVGRAKPAQQFFVLIT